MAASWRGCKWTGLLEKVVLNGAISREVMGYEIGRLLAAYTYLACGLCSCLVGSAPVHLTRQCADGSGLFVTTFYQVLLQSSKKKQETATGWSVTGSAKFFFFFVVGSSHQSVLFLDSSSEECSTANDPNNTHGVTLRAIPHSQRATLNPKHDRSSAVPVAQHQMPCARV